MQHIISSKSNSDITQK